jgi:histone H3
LFDSSDSDTDSDEEEDKNVAKAVTRNAQGQQAGGKQLPTRSVGKLPRKQLSTLSTAQQKKIKAAGREKAAAKDAANDGNPKPKRKYRKRKKTKYKNGDRALMEIRKYQKNSEILIAKRLFSKLVVREITEQVIQEDNAGTGSVRWQATAVLAIQTAVEDYIVKVFEAAQLNAIHSKRQTIMPKDMHLSRRQRRIFDDSAI